MSKSEWASNTRLVCHMTGAYLDGNVHVAVNDLTDGLGDGLKGGVWEDSDIGALV